MARVFKFKPGDVVRAKENRRPLVYDGVRYNDNLTVMYCFWSGTACCYVLNTGCDGICIVCDEEPLELVERAPMPAEEVHPECAKESYFLGYVYRVNNRLVAAEGIEQAIRLFHDHPSHRSETIEKIALQDKDLALIQNLKED